MTTALRGGARLWFWSMSLPNARASGVVVVLGVLAVALVACAPRAVRVTAAADPTTLELVELVNQRRAAGAVCGSETMPPAGRVSGESRLARAAYAHTADQAEHRFMGHGGSDGSTVGKRVTRAGYEWSLVAENVAWGFTSAEEVVAAWMDSPGHCLNIMLEGVTELGGAEQDTFWTLVLATPR